MITVNSLSGGKTSSFIAAKYPANYELFSLVCIDDKNCTPKDKSLVYYVNAKLEKFIPEFGEFIATAEDDATLVAMRDLEQYLGKEIIWVRGKSFDDVIDLGTQTRLPSWARRYCTEQMKLEPIFRWWFNNIGEKCEMRIGFRFDEFDRMQRFFNNSNPTNFKIPVSCSTKGQRLQRHENFNWRFCSFPLIKDGITKKVVEDYWRKNGWIGGNLFEEKRQIEFPVVSNCVGCFHKKPETLCVMAAMHPEKMKWFALQEDKEMGTWLDSKVKYETFIAHSQNWIPEMIKENASCDSGGCTD
ncbi:MAG TPA: hypothetical protein PK289_00210 [Bacteroidia bacterium]|nr:hypothetical protein [Bacteroidia bacterium]